MEWKKFLKPNKFKVITAIIIFMLMVISFLPANVEGINYIYLAFGSINLIYPFMSYYKFHIKKEEKLNYARKKWNNKGC